MSEKWGCESLPSDHLWGLIDHANSQIEMWERRAELAIAQLAIRGEFLPEYPIEN